MKTLVRTITVFVVFNLAMGSFALAEYATEEKPAPIADEEVGVSAVEPLTETEPKQIGEANVAKGAYDLIYNRRTGEADVAKSAYNYKYIPYKSPVTKKQPGGAGAVLVIPSGEMKAEELAAIMEDLSVMSRIFDKKVNVSQVSGILGDKVLINGKWHRYKASDYYDYVLSPRDKRVTEAIYLGGFGAMFLTSVDFPLSPPPEVEEKKKAKEDVDSVWSDTKREIYSPEETTGIRELTSGGGTRQKEKGRVQKYDAERVEELKRTLTKALKHAANIRGLKGDELVTVVVRGSGPAFVVRIMNGEQWWEAAEPGAGLSLPTFLTIRAKKSDIDAFSKKELDDAEFRKRTQIITY